MAATPAACAARAVPRTRGIFVPGNLVLVNCASRLD